MPTEIPIVLSVGNVVDVKTESRGFTDDFFAVVVFSGIGLLVTLIAVACGVQGEWF
jgi:hypothetical protein